MRDSPPADVRERLLRAAAQVYAEVGFRGATTRRIAHAAGVSEITLFRHFGCKHSLLHEALQHSGLTPATPALPEVPADPESELTHWCREHLQHLSAESAIIRTMMGEIEERPELRPCASEGTTHALGELRRYVARLAERGLISPEADTAGATMMLMGAIFGDAIGRDFMPDLYGFSREEAPERYARLFLGAVGLRARAVELRAGAVGLRARGRRGPRAGPSR